MNPTTVSELRAQSATTKPPNPDIQRLQVEVERLRAENANLRAQMSQRAPPPITPKAPPSYFTNIPQI